MKKATFILAVLFGSMSLFAQVHGVSPSVTSFNGKTLGNGPAPSVTSLGPRGWNFHCNTPACINPNFTPTINFRTGTVEFGKRFNIGGRNFKGRGRNFFGGTYVYGYGYPYPVYVVPQEAVTDQGDYEVQDQDQSEPPAPTIFERRSESRPAPNPTPVPSANDQRYGQGYLDVPEQQPAAASAEPAPQSATNPIQEPIPVVLVFKDGRVEEVRNYAIAGDTLYELGGFVAHKIKLSELDLKQTIEKNEERGVEFNVPAGYKPEV